MLRQGSVADLKSGRVSRADGHIVLAMRQHPRGVSKELRDEYVKELAPAAELLKLFLAEKRRHPGDHNYAFHAVGYERRFDLAPEALEKLKFLAERGQTQDVVFVCQCGDGERCHRELLLLLAHKLYGARTETLRFEYLVFAARIRRDGLKPAATAQHNSA